MCKPWIIAVLLLSGCTALKTGVSGLGEAYHQTDRLLAAKIQRELDRLPKRLAKELSRATRKLGQQLEKELMEEIEKLRGEKVKVKPKELREGIKAGEKDAKEHILPKLREHLNNPKLRTVTLGPNNLPVGFQEFLKKQKRLVTPPPGVDLELQLLAFHLDQIGFSFLVFEGCRTAEKQAEYFRKGVSKLDGVTKISNHQICKAIDIVSLDKNGKLDWQNTKRLAYIAGVIRTIFYELKAYYAWDNRLCFRWGGAWDSSDDVAVQSFEDAYHFELRNGVGFCEKPLNLVQHDGHRLSGPYTVKIEDLLRWTENVDS